MRSSIKLGMLALLAVWHNHRVLTRGVNTRKSPLHLSGKLDAPTDWLVALGYPPAAAPMRPGQLETVDMARGMIAKL